MLRYIYHNNPRDAHYIKTFRNIATLYYARNLEYQDLLMEHAQLIVSRKDMTIETYNILNNPITR